jgi:hypothetical protein
LLWDASHGSLLVPNAALTGELWAKVGDGVNR